jgi:Zn-dependent peptidase ImmA (M78 family)/transcriptional regulator with XRE-family HTH domain
MIKMNEDALNGDRLRLARLLSGLTQQELGDAVSVSRQYIHQLEGGAKQPSEEVLEALLEVLRVEKGFCYDPKGQEVKFEQCHFRKRKTTPVNLANRVLAYSTVFERLVEYINARLELPRPALPPVEGIGDSYDAQQIEQAAQLCRGAWGIPLDAPIANVTRVLERAGVVITHFKGVSDKVDALSVNRKFPFIIRNDAKESVCRMRFDLAHECGHFVLHDGIETGDAHTEAEADKFASALIFPRSAFLREFPDFRNARIDWAVVYRLKVRWGMSARALIYQAYNFGRITAQQYRSANVWLNKSGQARRERYDEQVSPEKPDLLAKSFDVMRSHLGITFDRVAGDLAVKPELLAQITGIEPGDESYLANVVPFR